MQIAIKAVPKNPASVQTVKCGFQVMAWRRTSDNTSHETMMAQLTDSYMRAVDQMGFT